MLKYLKPQIIPITFILFFLGNVITFIIVWGFIGFLAFEFTTVQIGRIVMIASILPALWASKIFYTSVLPFWVIFSIKKTENLHFLKYFLVQSKIINKNILENENKDLIKNLTIKSSQEEFIEDQTVDEETIVKQSYAELTGILITTIIISILIYLSNSENKIFAILLFIIGILISLWVFKTFRNQKFAFKLSNNGVWLNENKLVRWEQIKSNKNNKDYQSDFIKRVTRNWFFTFNYIDINKKSIEYSIKINDLNINSGRLNYLIYVYKNRYKKIKKSSR